MIVIEEMSHDTTYLLCPDKMCTLFTKPNCPIPCERDCPHEDKLKKIVVCSCGEIVVLPGSHHDCCRVEHECKPGIITWIFTTRMSGKYHRIFEMPEKSGNQIKIGEVKCQD